MSIATVKAIKWSDKAQLRKATAYVGGFGIALILTMFKLAPYFESHPMIRVFSSSSSGDPSEKKLSDQDQKHISETQNGPPAGFLGRSFAAFHTIANPGSGQPVSRPKNSVIERPLFDGLMVTLRVVLTQSLSSNQGTPTVEAKLVDGADLGGSYEASFLKGATLTGTSNPNFETKRYNLQFSELIGVDGKHYSVTAFAFDENAQVVGIQANYSSGLVSRLAGSVLGRVIQIGEDVGTARVLTNSGSGDSVAAMEMNRAFLDTTHEATGNISEEVTSGLRGTRPELSIPAGTVFTIKLKASSTLSGGIL